MPLRLFGVDVIAAFEPLLRAGRVFRIGGVAGRVAHSFVCLCLFVIRAADLRIVARDHAGLDGMPRPIASTRTLIAIIGTLTSIIGNPYFHYRYRYFHYRYP